MEQTIPTQRDWSTLEKLTCILLFGSGFSALTYQTVWMREFRLVFGASTASTAAVSALFMAGLGVGGWFLGPRADRQARPLWLYARLELAIAILAAVSPFLLMITRKIYLASGGMMVLGLTGATIARLLLAAIVVGVPAFLMGGTLPAAVRAVTSETDGSRRSLGVLYGVNTLGSLLGVLLTTFILLELLGARATLFLAVAVNLAVVLAAKKISERQTPVEVDAVSAEAPETPERISGAAAENAGLSPKLALAVAGGVGFAFFLMELVWYRMLAPILGGSTYTFGLILAVALAGIGLGGACYPLFMRNRRPGTGLLAATCLLESLFMLVPYAVGDWVAAFAVQLTSLSAMGFGGIVIAWSLVTVAIVFPAAFISGVQFPLLIALLGRGAGNIGEQTGRAYSCNTLGAIVGSLAGGFGLMPLLTAPGCWLLAGGLLAAFGLVIALSTWRADSGESERHRIATTIAAAALSLLAILCCLATGPTAAWRHSPIGAGRAGLSGSNTEIRDWMAQRRLVLDWEADGVESSVGITNEDGYSFLVNGKSDGNVIGDRGTQMTCGLVGAVLHPAPRKALVVGLGTGCTAGWLSEVQTMERVDVVELETAVLHMGRLSAIANHDVVGKAEKGDGVRIIINDAREVLNTIPEQYDIIASEPSNPYRAGIASLFTVEFYEEVRNRLTPDGIFVSWCQAYEIDTETVFTILATLKSVFPHVECWMTQTADLAFVASMRPVMPDPDMIRRRIGEYPYADAMRIAWGVEGFEGLLGHFLATDDFTSEIARLHRGGLNTDDRMRVEYDYARTVGRGTDFSPVSLFSAATERRQSIPKWVRGQVSLEKVLLTQCLIPAFYSSQISSIPDFIPEPLADRVRLVEAWRKGSFSRQETFETWNTKETSRLERLVAAESLAWHGKDEALDHLAAIGDWWPASASFVRAQLLARKGETGRAVEEMEKACAVLRHEPWEIKSTIMRGIVNMTECATDNPEYAERLFAALEEPFALSYVELHRRFEILKLAKNLAPEKSVRVLARWFEPNVPWRPEILENRAIFYRAVGSPLLEKAEADFVRYKSGMGKTVQETLQLWQGAAQQERPRGR